MSAAGLEIKVRLNYADHVGQLINLRYNINSISLLLEAFLFLNACVYFFYSDHYSLEIVKILNEFIS